MSYGYTIGDFFVLQGVKRNRKGELQCLFCKKLAKRDQGGRIQIWHTVNCAITKLVQEEANGQKMDAKSCE